MNLSQKNDLFSRFLAQWDREYRQVKGIIKYLNSYPQLPEKVELNLLDDTELDASQLEWVSLVARFEHPLEKEFFRSYWVPVSKQGMYCFIDLSSTTFELFHTHYYPFEPWGWFKQQLFPDISVLLHAPEVRSVNLDEIMAKSKEDLAAGMRRMQQKRDELGLSGKLSFDLPDAAYLFDGWDSSNCSLDGKTLKIENINRNFIGLLPLNTEVRITDFTSEYYSFEEIAEKVKNVNSLVYAIRNCIDRNQSYFRAEFSDGSGCIEWQAGEITIKNTDDSLLQNLYAKFHDLYDSYKNIQTRNDVSE